MGRRWAATYTFHLGQIQLPREGRDGEIQQLTERVNRPIRHTRLQHEMRFLAMYNTCSHARNKDNNRTYVGRRWAATYIFHLGQIQLPK